MNNSKTNSGDDFRRRSSKVVLPVRTLQKQGGGREGVVPTFLRWGRHRLSPAWMAQRRGRP